MSSVISGQSYFSAPSGGGGGGGSVFTHSSVATTQSMRSRRPGAAKERLAKAKEAEDKRKSGWHESMEAAAASAHRVWEPKDGWIDYKEDSSFQDDAVDVLNISDEKFHVPLHVFAKPKKGKTPSNSQIGGGMSNSAKGAGMASSTSNQAVEIRFPKEWQKERTEMLGAYDQNQNPSKKVDEKLKKYNKLKARKARSPARIVDSIPASLDGKEPQENEAACWPANRHKGARHSPERHRRQEQSPPKNKNKSPIRRISVIPPAIRRVTNESPTKQRQNPPERRQLALSPVRQKHQEVFRNRRSQSLSPVRVEQGSPNNSLPPAAPPRAGREWRQRHFSGSPNTAAANSVRPRPESPMQFSLTSNSPARSTRSKGWVETMRDATAHLAKEGHSWDPRHGFTNLDASSVSNIITRGSAEDTVPLPARDDQRNHLLMERSPAEVLESMIAERRKHDPPGRRNPVLEETVEEDPNQADAPPSSPTIATPTPTSKSPTVSEVPEEETNKQKEIAIAADETKTEDHQSTMPEPIEVTPVGVIDTMKRSDFGLAALNFEENEDYMLGPSAPIVVTPNISVRKEKVAEEDLGWFPKSQEAGRRQPRAKQMDNATNKSTSSNIKPSSASSRSTNRRDSGPVDVDEVSSASSDEATETSFNVWKAANFENDSFLQGSISSRKVHEFPNAQSSFPRQESEEKPIAWSEHAKRLAKTVTNNTNKDSSGLPKESGDNSNDNEEQPEENQEPIYSNFRDIKDGGRFAIPNAQENSNGRAENEARVVHSTDEPNIYPQEIDTDNKSQMSGASSVTAGWKSFLNKKVQAEKAVAVSQQRFVYSEDSKQQEKEETKDDRIKKNVSFASDISDSLLAESSIFDFSTSEGPSLKSPGRSRSNLGEGASSGSLIGASCTQSGGQDQPSERNFHSISSNRQYRSTGSRDSSSLNRGSSYELNSFRKNRSFGTDVSPIMEQDEESESAAGTEPEQYSFLQRLAECRGPILPTQLRQRGSEEKGDDERKEDAGVPNNPYYNKVEEMMEILRSRRCVVRGRAGDSTKPEATSSSTFRDKLSARLQVSRSSHPETQSGSNNNDVPGRDFDERPYEDLAKARVQAMIDTLYYTEE